jgi:hypothetical protein
MKLYGRYRDYDHLLRGCFWTGFMVLAIVIGRPCAADIFAQFKIYMRIPFPALFEEKLVNK